MAPGRSKLVKGRAAPDERSWMQPVLAGVSVFAVVSLWVGGRLLWLGMRSGRAPELLIGLGVLGIGPIGFGLQTAALTLGDGPLGETLATASATSIAIGIWAKLAFNWLVYRRDERWAQVLAAVLAAGVAAFLLAFAARGSFFAAAEGVMASALRGTLQAVALAWGATEALLYWLQMRRRLRLRLADPVIANRILLWGISAGSAALGTTIGVVASLATGKAALAIPAVLASSSVHGLVAALAMWLAFVPPQGYRRWIAGSRAVA